MKFRHIYQKPRKRSILINGHNTSISLEDTFWESLCTIAKKEKKSINNLVTEIDLFRESKCSLAGAIRLYILSEKNS